MPPMSEEERKARKRELNKAYYEANRDRAKAYYEANKEKILKKRKVYREVSGFLKSGNLFRCYVNPKMPAQAVLYRDMRWFLLFFYVIFLIAFGGFGLGIVFFKGKLSDGMDTTEPRGGDKDVDAAELLDCFFDNVFHIIGVSRLASDIGRHTASLLDLPGKWLQCLGCTASEHHFGASLGQPLGARLPKATCRTCDECHLVGNIK